MIPSSSHEKKEKMIKSMTGFGSSMHENEDYEIRIEIRTVNSKFLDCSLRLPRSLQSAETRLRQIATQELVRGKANVNVELTSKKEAEQSVSINDALFEAYFLQLRNLTAKFGESKNPHLIQSALQMPGVMESKSTELSETLMPLLEEAMREACNSHRVDEGNTLTAKFEEYINAISAALAEVAQLEEERLAAVKQKLRKGLQELAEEADENRFEQELIYYIEKLDIVEEKVRLKTHLDYFIQVMKGEQAQGKKLGFISQEIGREINTIGSKASYAPMQQQVVQMKDELEKVKEQLLNVL